MKKLRRYTLSAIASILLLCFSVVALPTELFHRHQQNQLSTSCKTASGQHCQHKMHLGNTVTFCWVCAVHFDKDFTSFVLIGISCLKPDVRNLAFELVSGTYQSVLLQHDLRGPPNRV